MEDAGYRGRVTVAAAYSTFAFWAINGNTNLGIRVVAVPADSVRLGDLVQHFGQELHRKTYHVRCAPVDDVNPAEAVLVAERAGLALPLATGEVLVELLIGESVHSQRGNGDAN